MTIDEFINELTYFKNSDTVTNMYRGNGKRATACRENLKKYLTENQDAEIMLLGEAPGYKGCARTGVPFTSDDNEMSAGIIQEMIQGKKVIIWNAFPFHPHEPKNSKSNRTPNKSELEAGEGFFHQLLSALPNVKCFGAIGRTAEKTLKQAGQNCSYIRHPSHGGKTKCQKGLEELFSRYEKMKKSGLPTNTYFPNFISKGDVNPYINKMKIKYIISACCEGNDLWYEHVGSEWFMNVKFRIGDRYGSMTIWGYGLFKPLEEKIKKSGEFIVEDERPLQLRRYTYVRKK